MLHHETWKILKGPSDKSFFSTGDLIDSHLPSRVRKFAASPRQLRHEFRWAFRRNFCDGARRTSCHQNKHRFRKSTTIPTCSSLKNAVEMTRNGAFSQVLRCDLRCSSSAWILISGSSTAPWAQWPSAQSTLWNSSPIWYSFNLQFTSMNFFEFGKKLGRTDRWPTDQSWTWLHWPHGFTASPLRNDRLNRF